MLDLTSAEEIALIVGFIVTGMTLGLALIISFACQLALKRAVTAGS